MLRALITNYKLPTSPDRLDSELTQSVAQALDLCLACKGCKAECPSGVDMAKLKFAFQAEYYKTHRRQWRDYVFGYFHVTAGLSAAAAPLMNGFMRIPVIRNLVAKILGITPHRPFPKFSSHRVRLKYKRLPGRRRIIFLSDSFARYIEPEIEQAALDILTACGFDVHVLPIVGAGASFLSKAFIDQARAHAERVLDALNQIDPQKEMPVVGMEPPEIYMFKDDFVDLLPDRGNEISQRTTQVWLLDEFLLRSPEFNTLRIANKERLPSIGGDIPKRKVYFHPHCHQRAQGPSPDGLPNGVHATIELLRSCGYDAELMDTGCCGMAGTFGYEVEHYDLSMKIGALKLFPAIGGLGKGKRIVSSGAACRMQIQQGTGVLAVHPIVPVAKQIHEWKAHDKR